MANNEYTISKIELPNGDVCNIKDTTYDFNTAYNETTNKAATMADIKTDNIKPIKSASFTTGKYGQDGSGTHYYEMLGSITPTSFEQMWLLHYIITIEVPSDTTYTYRADVEIYGVRNTYGAYKIFNSFYSKYPIYQHVILEGASSSYPHEFGYRLASSYGDTTVNKNIHIDIIETRNCTAAFFNAPKAYTSSAPSNYTWCTFNATSNGLQETGDADTITRLYAGNNSMIVSSNFRLPGAAIFGFDRDNHAQGISLYSDGYTSTTTSINVNRVYNTAGFDWTKGLFYNTSSNFATGAEVTPGIDQSIHGIDFRYTDNCVNSSTLSTLGLERYKAVYLRGTIGTDGLFYLAPLTVSYNNQNYKRAWTQDIPTSADGYVYWFLGFPYYKSSYAGGYHLNFYLENKLFWYHNGKFQEYIGDAVTVNGHTVNKDVPSDAKFTDNNTTYTFENGTNGFKVTPLGGTAQTVTVTPSITNNVTGSGTSGYLAKFNGANTITNGPQLGSSTTTFLRNDGTWQTPPYPVTSVAGKTGVVTLVKGDVGLGSVDNTSDANKQIYEANLLWGGKNFAASYGPIDAAMIGELGADRLAFFKPEGVTIEYSRDNGSTWTDYGATDLEKQRLFSIGGSFFIGKADSTNKATANGTKYQLRITLNSELGYLYTVLNKIAIYVSTGGSSNCTVTIDKALKSSPTTYTTHIADVPINGWSGWNIINISELITYGNSQNYQYVNIRFTFKADGGNTDYTGLAVSKIMGFGGVGWATPSTMAKTGHLYDFDASQDAIFPADILPKVNNTKNLGNSSYKWANVYATTFTGNLTGNVSGTAANVTGTVAIEHGGTGATTASNARTNLGLGNVENTALSTWAGTNKITTLGTITTGTWQGTAIAASYIGNHSTDKLTSGTLPVARGGTGQTSIANIQAGKDGDGNTISSTYLKLSGGTLTGDLNIRENYTWTLSLSNDLNSGNHGLKSSGYGQYSYSDGRSMVEDEQWLVYRNASGDIILNGNATNVNGTVDVNHGGTGATNAAGARANLGITPANIGAAPAILVTTVPGTPDSDGNISLGLSANSYIVVAAKIPSLIVTPWVSGGDGNWHARITGVNGGAVTSGSVTVKVYYQAL